MFVRREKKLIRSLTERWKPYKFQKTIVDLGILKRFLAVFIDPGLGKTSIILQIFNKLKIRKQVRGLLVVAPINPCYMTWPQEIKGWSNFKRFSYVILHGKNKDIEFNKKVDIYIINPEGLPWLVQKMKGKHRKNWPFNMLVVDESYKFKNAQSKRTLSLLKFIPGFKARFILNGTPTGNGYINLMAQIRIVDQGQSLGTKITHYRDRYFKQVGKPEWAQYELLPHAEEKITKKIAPFTICLRAEDHIDMPKLIPIVRFISLPTKAKKAYEEIEEELFTIIDSKEFVAESAQSVSTKLHQICNGILYEDQDPLGKPLPASKRKLYELHKEKIFELEDLIEEVNGAQILIAYKFKHDKTALENHFKNKITFFDKAKTGKAKQQIQDKWNAGKIRILAGNAQSISHGLNLQKSGAQYIVFYSVDHDYETYDQFIRRLRRNGNPKDKVFVYHLLAKGLYDHKVIYASLQDRNRIHIKFFKRLINYRKYRKGVLNSK